MILGFKTMFPWGEPTNFKDKILKGVKKTTIRKRINWRVGDEIQFCAFDDSELIEQFATGKVKISGNIIIQPSIKMITIGGFTNDGYKLRSLLDENIELISKDDGFDSVDDFWKYFDKPLQGQIISWKLD
jgi:hypothetical protein